MTFGKAPTAINNHEYKWFQKSLGVKDLIIHASKLRSLHS